jgi:hypothetical protein
MHSDFGDAPTEWADQVILRMCEEIVSVKENSRVPHSTVREMVQAYRRRYATYWSHLGAFTKEATPNQLEAYGYELTRVFIGTPNPVFAPPMLMISNAFATELFAHVRGLESRA